MEYSSVQYVHDEAVRRCALQLLSDGYEVMARVAGWFQAPSYVYGYRPDIVAEKAGHFLIVEIKKGATDWPKISALQRYVQEQQNYEVRILSPGDVISNASAGMNGQH